MERLGWRIQSWTKKFSTLRHSHLSVSYHWHGMYARLNLRQMHFQSHYADFIYAISTKKVSDINRYTWHTDTWHCK